MMMDLKLHSISWLALQIEYNLFGVDMFVLLILPLLVLCLVFLPVPYCSDTSLALCFGAGAV